ncbi:hypothetical protein GH741_04640 [Aquibacillus halophilus]|uniref:Uncharacterized protein n=1 Tax=Aquibacillus halophilus TaxID=930132 RepID=A0A6A8DDV8_9BACI|nr:hypothetical protein [Aquibacillus halophilus]MRH41961.1 hypothetical protein [Aquibacillus halophilus]
MKEQEIYKSVLKRLVDQSESLQIDDAEELIQRLIKELNYHQLPKL